MCGEAVLPLAWRHRFLHFLRLPCTMAIPCRTISDRETFSVFAASSNFLTDSSSNRTRNITALGLFVGRPIFFCPLMLAPPFCSDNFIVDNVATYVNRFRIMWKTFTISYRAWCWYAGHHPASLCCQCGTRTPSFPFLEKEKKGEKRKSLNPQTRKKRTRQIKGVLSNKKVCSFPALRAR